MATPEKAPKVEKKVRVKRTGPRTVSIKLPTAVTTEMERVSKDRKIPFTVIRQAVANAVNANPINVEEVVKNYFFPAGTTA